MEPNRNPAVARVATAADVPVQRERVYCDEACTDGKKFYLIGSLWVPLESEPELRAAATAVRTKHGRTGEFKWSKITTDARKAAAYREFADLFFDRGLLRFKCIVVDVGLIDCKKFSMGDGELSFEKMYFQLLSRTLRPNTRYHVITDNRTTKRVDSLATLQRCCNRYFCKSYIGADEPIRRIEPRDSHTDDLLQLCDVLVGAVGCKFNNSAGNPQKLAMIKHLETRRGVSLLAASLPSGKRFNVWPWRPNLK